MSKEGDNIRVMWCSMVLRGVYVYVAGTTHKNPDVHIALMWCVMA